MSTKTRFYLNQFNEYPKVEALNAGVTQNREYKIRNTENTSRMLLLKISPNSIQSHTQNSPKNKQTDRQSCIQYEGDSNMTDRQTVGEKEIKIERDAREIREIREKQRNSN